MSSSHEDDRGAYLPTAEQIAAECLSIQATWTPYERKLRSGWRAADHKHDTPGLHYATLSDLYGALNSFESDASAIRDYAPNCE